jgi:hypothetical protein
VRSFFRLELGKCEEPVDVGRPELRLARRRRAGKAASGVVVVLGVLGGLAAEQARERDADGPGLL